MKWFREWRAWVRDKKEQREQNLVFAVVSRVHDVNPQTKVSNYWAESVIALVRRYDREGIS